MMTEGSLLDKGNAWKLVYAAYVAVENAPEDFLVDEIDEDGNYYEIPMLHTPDELKYSIRGVVQEEIEFRRIRFSQALGTFVKEYESGKFTVPFTYEAYKHNDDIIATLEAYDLDVEQFWYAVLFIYWITQVRCVNVVKREGSVTEQMQKLKDYLQGVDKFTITADGKKKLVINDVNLIRGICRYMNNEIAEYEKMGLGEAYSVDSNVKGEHLESSSVQMWFSAERYLKLFDNLELPTIRAIGSEVKYKKIEGDNFAIGGGNKTVSYNKMLLISRLMYFTKLTTNDNFLYLDESLKGIVKQYKSLKIKTYNPKYWSF